MWPLLKYQSETVNERSASRSRFRTPSGRRKSARPSRKATQNASQTPTLLISLPPNAPLPPRAIFQATCGPVHASVTVFVASSTRPVATSPAGPDQILIVQLRYFELKVVSYCRVSGG